MDVTETGTTIEANNLRIIDTVMKSAAILIANKKALEDPEKREKIYDIVALLKGVVDGSKRIHIFVNVKKANLQKLLTELPALKNPTIAPLADDTWVSVNTVIEKDCLIELLPKIRKIAQGLVVYEPRQVLALDEIARRNEGRCEKDSHKSLEASKELPADWFKRQQADQKATQELETNVKAIINQVRADGDRALVEFAQKFDKAKLTAKTLQVSSGRNQGSIQ